MTAIDDLIRVLRQRLRQAKRAKRMYRRDPALAVRMALTPLPLVERPHPNRDKTTWQHVEEYFLARQNQWAFTEEVCSGTGLRRSVATKLLRRTHSHLVESKRMHGFARTAWRLRGNGISEINS